MTRKRIWLRVPASALLCGWIFEGGLLYAQTNQQTVPTVVPHGQPQESGQLLDFNFKSKDRMVEGEIKIPDSWKATSLRILNTTTGQDMGTYGNVLENLTAPKPTFKIYNHQADFFSAQDAQDAQHDPAVTEQKVVFFKDDGDPRLLHFATTFDEVGTIQVQVIQDGKQIGYGETKLTPDADFSSLINAVDKGISGPPPPIIDPTDPNDPGGRSDGLGLLVAEEPGSLSSPGQIDPQKNDPRSLLIPAHAGTATPTPNDADLALLTLRRPIELKSNSGIITLTISSPAAVTVFNEAATQILSGYTVDLGKPSGDLAALARGNARVWVRGVAVADDIVFTYTYTDADGKVQDTDKVHMSVGKP